MSAGERVTEAELLRAVLHTAPVRIGAIDRTGRLLLDPDPNPPLSTDSGAPPGANFLEMYGELPGLRDAVAAAFGGEQKSITRQLGGTTYSAALIPRRNERGEVDAVLIIATFGSLGHPVERALGEMQVRERRIFNSNMVGLAYWNGAGLITDANEAFLKLVGYAGDDLDSSRLSWAELTVPESHAADDAALAQIRERGVCTPYEKELWHKNGERIAVLVGAAAWELGHDSGVGFVVDITERRRCELERRQADEARVQLQAQLLQVQKLEGLGLLAGGIAHDFNNILTPILGGASSALMTIPAENPARKSIEMVITAAQRASGLIRQMLAYSGKAHVEIHPLDLSGHVREISSLLETTVSKKVQLRLELQLDLPAIEADVSQLQQIIMNLVINGAEAIGDQQGTVLVTTGVQAIDTLYATSLFAAEGLLPGEYVFLEVHDTGHGMDEVTKNKIFDPFFTTKFTGRGLGLAAVLGIVRSHKGAIKVYSSPGRGTTFKIFFPAARRPARQLARSAALDYRGEGLVLVVDDDAGVRAAMRDMLEYFGFSVIEAPDGQAGAETFAQRASEITLCIVDMTMPRMNGEETFRAIRRVRADVPVILTSGYNEIEATRRFTSKGLAGFIEKPFMPSELAAKLAAVLPMKGK